MIRIYDGSHNYETSEEFEQWLVGLNAVRATVGLAAVCQTGIIMCQLWLAWSRLPVPIDAFERRLLVETSQPEPDPIPDIVYHTKGLSC